MSTEYEPYCCELCGAPPEEIVGRGEDYEYRTLPTTWEYAICRPCVHLYLAKRPRHEHVATIYPSSYYTVNPQSPVSTGRFVRRLKLRMEMTRIGRLVSERGIESILDVGCGDATRLVALREHLGAGVTLAGVDFLIAEPTRTLAKQHEIECVEQDVEQIPPDGPTYDMMLMSQLIEHLFSPAATLKKLFQRLRPGGLMLIETPEWGSLDYWLFRRRYWGAYHFPRHFNIFSAESLRRLVTACGFEVVEQQSLPSPAFWILSLRNALGLNSCRRTRSPFEFLNCGCVAVVAMMVLWDKLWCAFGGRTSNQSIIVRRPL